MNFTLISWTPRLKIKRRESFSNNCPQLFLESEKIWNIHSDNSLFIVDVSG